MVCDVVGGRVAARLCQPSFAKADEHPGEATTEGRVVAVAELAGPAGQIHDDRRDELGPDRLQEAGLLKGFRVAERFGHHPGEAERQHGVGEDPVRRAFEGDDVGQPDEAGLGRGVVRLQVLAEHARRRRDEDEAAVALCLHHPERRLRQVETAVEVHPQHAAPIVGRQLVERDAVEDSRIADHRVQPSEPIDGGADDRLAALGTVDRIVRRHCRAAGSGDLRDDLVRDGRVGAVTVHGPAEVIDHHRCAATRQLDRVEAAEAPPRAGDHRNLAFEVDHVLHLPGVR